MTDLAALTTEPRPFFDVSRGCLCCEVLHPGYDDGIADLRLKLEAERERVLVLMYTVELLLGKPLALLHQAWLTKNARCARSSPADWTARVTDPCQVSDLRRFWFEYLLIGVLVLCIVGLVVAMFGLAGVFGRYVG